MGSEQQTPCVLPAACHLPDQLKPRLSITFFLRGTQTQTRGEGKYKVEINYNYQDQTLNISLHFHKVCFNQLKRKGGEILCEIVICNLTPSVVESSTLENKSKSINFYIFMFQTFNLALMPGLRGI